MLQTVTDDGGSESANMGFGEDLTSWNKYRITVCSGHAKFYLNETEIADHAANLPDVPMYLAWRLHTDGGACLIEIANVRIWPEDVE